MPLDRYDFYKRLSVRLFGKLADKTLGYFKELKTSLISSYMQVLLKTWVSMMFFTSVITFVVSLAALLVLSIVFPLEGMLFISLIGFVPIGAACAAFAVMYMYPVQKRKAVKKSIDLNLPFALAHMNAIASSGIPPEFMFELLTDLDEYGEVANQAQLVVRNIKTLGMSSISAINDVASKTPSDEFRDVLTGISTTIEKGGNLTTYVRHMSDMALFDYKIRREKYLKTLSTYADIYTALLVAAPLMMLAILGIMGIIGGTVLGLTVEEMILFMTWAVLPIINIIFLVFLHVTHPGM